MSAVNSTEPLPIGTLVKIRDSGFHRARVVEYRGNLGPKGARIYRLLIRRKPSPAYIEVREDQIEVLGESVSPSPTGADAGPGLAQTWPMPGQAAPGSPLIVTDPAIMMGKPVVRGTSITVESILDRLAAGESGDRLIESQPELTPAAIAAALSFAARALPAGKASTAHDRPNL